MIQNPPAYQRLNHHSVTYLQTISNRFVPGLLKADRETLNDSLNAVNSYLKLVTNLTICLVHFKDLNDLSSKKMDDQCGLNTCFISCFNKN